MKEIVFVVMKAGSARGTNYQASSHLKQALKNIDMENKACRFKIVLGH